MPRFQFKSDGGKTAQVSHNPLTHSFVKEVASQMMMLPQKQKARRRKSILFSRWKTWNVLQECQMLLQNVWNNILPIVTVHRYHERGWRRLGSLSVSTCSRHANGKGKSHRVWCLAWYNPSQSKKLSVSLSSPVQWTLAENLSMVRQCSRHGAHNELGYHGAEARENQQCIIELAENYSIT